MNRLTDRLSHEYRQLVDQYETIINRLADEGRDPTDTETAILDGLRSEMEPMGNRLVELRETDERRWAAVRAMNDAPAISGSPGSGSIVQVRSEPEVYRKPDAGATAPVFFRDLLHAQVDGDPDARSRIDRHQLMMRATGTTTTGAGVVPPTWLFQEFAVLQHGARPWSDVLRRVGIADANPVNIGRQVTPRAAVANQGGEGNPAPDGSFNANILTTQPVTTPARSTCRAS
jgi:hypothetical protein